MSAVGSRLRGRRGAAPWPASLLVVVLAILLGGCRSEPEEQLPAGTLWAGDAQQAARLLQGLEGLQGTPVGLAAADLRHRLAGCRRFVAFCPAEGRCTLAGSLRCEPTDPIATLADEVRGDAGWVLVQRTPNRLLTARGTSKPRGDVLVRATLRADPGNELWQALLPARRGTRPPILGDAGALMHLRLRSDRGAASLAKLGEGDWGEQLFGLREKVFLAMQLEGTVEVAVFEPAPGELIPPLAAAIHVRKPEPAAESMETLIAGLRARWGVARHPWRFGTADGACLDDLNVLPDLAPCYVATERALVLGWNRRSVARALGAAPASAASDASNMVVALDRFAKADRQLRAAYHSRGGAPARYAWSRATLSGARRWSTYHLELALRAPYPAVGGDER